MATAASRAKSTATRAGNSKPLEYLARGGFVAYGVIHLLFAWLAAQIAFSGSSKESDQSGALAELASKPFGQMLVGLVVIGLIGLAVWQAINAAVGADSPNKRTGSSGSSGSSGTSGSSKNSGSSKPGRSGNQGDQRERVVHRVGAAMRAIVYLVLAYSGIKILVGNGSSSADKQQQAAFTLMNAPAGRWLVGLVGIVVVAVGVGLFIYGIRKKFQAGLNTQKMTPTVRATTRRLGVAGYCAKGVAYALAGVLVVAAAVTFDPNKARGLDAALRTLAQASYGPWLLGVIALGIAAFGVFCLAQAKYREV